MVFDQVIEITAPSAAVWTFLSDVPAVIRCVPGVDEFQPAGENQFEGLLSVRVGLISARLQGLAAIVEQDAAALRWGIDVRAADRRLGSTVTAKTRITLVPSGEATELRIHTEASILGKLGELGQAVIRRRADQMLQEFAANLARALAPPGLGGLPAQPSPRVGIWARLTRWMRKHLHRSRLEAQSDQARVEPKTSDTDLTNPTTRIPAETPDVDGAGASCESR